MEINIDAAMVGRALRTLDSFVSSATNSTANALRVYAEDGTLRLERNDYETIVSYDTGISVPDVADTYIPATDYSDVIYHPFRKFFTTSSWVVTR